ncbi:unnamed protein product [Paramecium pentaurelia]|uniref:NACHT domain-containing protein n=1 Tax=Paramecium pentaurelia TaxID=43138 RepID=A0A8S1UR68_9CILI|nr:unnamed protein product [Paramecium pentaurelia]
MEHYIFLTKSSFEMAPNNETEKNDILKGCLKGILQSFIKVSIDSDLLESLFKGACLLYKMYDINQKRKYYEVYFQIDNLLWELINYFKKNKQQNIQEIISHMEAIYEKLIKNSNNWNDHYCWIQMIGNILVYNPKINQKRLCQLSYKFQYLGLTTNQIWKDYINQKILISAINCKDWAIIQLNQLNNQKLTQTDKLILQKCFYGWENFILFKEYLMDDQSIIKQSNNPPSFESYLKNKLNLGNQNSESNEDFFNVNTIQKFLKYEKFDEKYNLNIKTTQRTFSQQIQTNISYLQEYFQNILNIMKIYNLYLNEKNIKNNLNKNIKNQEMIHILQLTYFMKLTEYIQQEYIKEIQERNNEKSGLQQSNNEIDEIFLKENEIIEQEICKLTKIKFQQKTQQIINNFYQKLLTLSKVFQDKKRKKKESLSLLKFFENSKKQMKIVENSLLQKDNLVLYFEITIKNLIQYYKFEYEKFYAEFDGIIQILKKIMIIKKKSRFLKIFLKKRLNQHLYVKAAIKINDFQEYLQNILSSAQQYTQELQQLKEIINLDEFLLDIIRDYPIRTNKSHVKVYKKTIQELNSMELTKIQFQNKLSKYQGILEFNIFQRKNYLHEFIDKILQIIEELNFSQSDKQNPQENLSQQKLKFEQEKLEVYQLIQEKQKISIGKEFLKKLIKQIEKIIQVLNNPLNQYIENNDIKQILKLTINGELVELKNILRQFNQYCTEQEKQQLKQNNLQFDVQRGQYQLENKINIQNNENYRVNLQIIANIIRLQQIKIQEEKQFLNQLLQVIQDFQKQSLIMKEETKEIINQHFNSYFYTLIKNFDNSQSTKIDLQQEENENFKTYFDRIQMTLQQEELLIDNIVEKRNSKKINLLDFFQKLKISIKKQLVINNKSSDISMEQEHLIQLIPKIYLNQDQQDFEEEPNQNKGGLFDSLKQNYKDFKNNDEWKIKQDLVFTLIQVSSNSTMDSINSYCQSPLIKLQKQEKDQRIRKQLKTKIQLIYWKIQKIKIAQEMQQLINKMDNLKIFISHEVNPNKRDQQLKELNDTNEQLDQYIQYISEMGKQFNLTIDFINQIRKELKKVEVKIKQRKINSIVLRKICTITIGNQKMETINNVKSLYVPLKTQRKGKNKTSNLMNLEQFNDKEGEVNEFLFDEKEIVLLVHGVAGSGKSTTAKKIEEFIWNLHNQNIKIGNKLLIPIYISLPSLKNPIYQVLEEALHQDDYGFDNLQLKECKELLEKIEFRFLLIMDGYDEMKLENISKNLYITNKVKIKLVKSTCDFHKKR